MKKSHRLYAIPLLALSLAACTNDGLQDDPLADGPVPLSVTADISAVATRAQATAFEEGDMIGIYPYKNNDLETVQANRLYTYSGGKFASTDPYYFQDRDEMTFNAYYPYDGNLTAENPRIEIDTRADNQVNRDDIVWRKNDYLFASNQTTVILPSVSYTGENAFKHVMSQVIFVFKAGTDSGVLNLSTLSQYKIATPLRMDGYFYASSGQVVPKATSTKEAITMGITGASGTEHICTPLFLLPQDDLGNTLSLEVTYNRLIYRASLTPPTGGLKAGYSYTYTVTIRNTALEVSNAEISDWITTVGSSGNATLQ